MLKLFYRLLKMGKKKILIIDDETYFGYFVKENLEATGNFEVSVCYDSKEGVKKVRELHPDLILLDILMPEVDGSDIAAELKDNEDTKDIPFIFLTAVVSEQETKKYENIIGGRYFVEKPVKIKELINVINSVIK